MFYQRQYRLARIILIITLVPALPLGKSIHKTGQQRSYIDIDVTDPFKVPKASEYVDQPIPKYDSNGNKKADASDHSINYKFDNIKVQTDNRVDIDDGANHNEDERYRSEDYHSAPFSRHMHNEMSEDGPEVPADQEESPRDLEPESYHSQESDSDHPHEPESYHSHEPEPYHSHEPESYHSHEPDSYHSHEPEPYHSHEPESYHSHEPDSPHSHEPEPYHSHDEEDEHIPGDSRHNVPKADWRQDDIEPISDQRSHEDPGAPWRNGDNAMNEDYKKRDDGERNFEESEDESEGEKDHYGGWGRKGEDHGRDYAPHYGPHDGPHEGSRDGPSDGQHEEPHGAPRDWRPREEEQRNEDGDENSRESGTEGEYFDKDQSNYKKVAFQNER